MWRVFGVVLAVMAACGGGGNSGSVTLTVSVTGMGTVTSMPSGVDCASSTCTASFAKGTSITLGETANGGATFTGWGGPCSDTSPTCTLTLSQDETVSASFAGGGDTHVLTVMVMGPGQVTSTPAGINCASGTCTASFAAGAMLTLQATPSGSNKFGGWGGACSGAGPCNVTLSADTTVIAGFNDGYVITVVISGDGGGTITSSPAGITCSPGSATGCSYDFGSAITSVTLTAAADATSSFAGMGVVGSGTGCNSDAYAASCSYSLSSSGATIAASFTKWHSRYHFPTLLAGIAQAGNTLLAVGAGSNAITSTNDATGNFGGYWTGRDAPADANAVVGTSTTFYAAENAGHVAATTDGITWTTYAAGTQDLYGIAYGASTLVAVGKSGAIQYSANGTAWTAASSGVAYDLLGVTYGNAQFVAVGFGGTILTSPDGVSWTMRTSGVTLALRAVTYGQSKYVAVGQSDVVVTSSDGITWTQPTTTGLPTTTTLRAVTASSSLYVAAGDTAINTDVLVYTSPDATTWTAHDGKLYYQNVTGLAYLNQFYALGAEGSLSTSSDGSTWSTVLPNGVRQPIVWTAWTGVAYNGTSYVAVGDSGSVFTSPDGATWTCRRVQGDRAFSAVQWGAGLATPVFAATITDNAGNVHILTSPDGITWTQAYPASGTVAGFLTDLAYGGATKGFVAVGQVGNTQGMSIASSDGITWTASTTAPSQTTPLTHVTYGNGKFVATGVYVSMSMALANLYTSTDGASWTQQSLPANTAAFSSVSYGNGYYVAIDDQAFRSSDGITWTSSTPPFTGGGLAFGNGVFLTSSYHQSADGVTWTQPSPPPPAVEFGVPWTSALYANGGWELVRVCESSVTHP